MEFQVKFLPDINKHNFETTKYKTVYLMVGEDPYNALKGKIPVKIGISNKVDRRKLEIHKNLKDKIVTIDGEKQSILISNPEIFAVSLPLPYAEAVEKEAQLALCRWTEKDYGVSAKISGYNDWFQTPNLLHAVLSIFIGIEAVEGDIPAIKDMQGSSTYHLLASSSYTRAHEFGELMNKVASQLNLIFSYMSDTPDISKSDARELKKTKSMYLIRNVSPEEHKDLQPSDDPQDWRMLVLSIRNCRNKKAYGRLRMLYPLQELIDSGFNLAKLTKEQLLALTLLIAGNPQYNPSGVGAVDSCRGAILLAPAITRTRNDGIIEWSNSIDSSPELWWKLAKAR